jgi:hypothetical protein
MMLAMLLELVLRPPNSKGRPVTRLYFHINDVVDMPADRGYVKSLHVVLLLHYDQHGLVGPRLEVHAWLPPGPIEAHRVRALFTQGDSSQARFSTNTLPSLTTRLEQSQYRTITSGKDLQWVAGSAQPVDRARSAR